MSTVRERDAAREKSAKAHAKYSDRLSALIADREKSGRLMVAVDKTVPYRATSQIDQGVCRHDLPASVCSSCRTLESYRKERRYTTVAKARRMMNGELSTQEFSGVKDGGWNGVPQGIPVNRYPNRKVKVRRYKQLPVRQPAQPPIGEEIPPSKPIIIAQRATSGGTRKRAKRESTEMRMEEALHGLVNHQAIARVPRVRLTEEGAQYCPWWPPKPPVELPPQPESGLIGLPLEMLAPKKRRQIWEENSRVVVSRGAR